MLRAILSGKLALVPAGAGDPFARLGAGDLDLYPRDDFRNGSGVRKPDPVEFFNASVGDVGMCVDKSGSGGMAVQIYDAEPRSITRECQNFSITTDLHDSAVAYRDGLGN